MQKEKTKYKAKDFASENEVKWCPGCGDYAILKQVQSAVAESGVPKEDVVFISGIGCSSRFPYYMDTYGMHGIHGRATAIASGFKIAAPDKSVWVVTGDGDSLSIGGNHLIHLLRRNIDTNILLFNNEIYGLTKGQYSPTSPVGLKTKSSPQGVIDHSFNPLSLALGAGAAYVARTIDREPRHMKQIFKSADENKGASFVEIYQNCPVFNDGAFNAYTDRSLKEDNTLFVEHGKPMVFAGGKKGIKLNGLKAEVVELGKDYTAEDCLKHDETDEVLAQILAGFFDNDKQAEFPRVFGVIYCKPRDTYEEALEQQIQEEITAKGKGDLDALIAGKNTWWHN